MKSTKVWLNVENLETENFKRLTGKTSATPRAASTRRRKFAPSPRIAKDLWPMNPVDGAYNG